ncbi:MAG TPA: DUF4830 domain-containing protein [Bacillales bacterium]|nr:DUF4830 domain-containing protein [Bacillales bacterium]
MKLWMTGLLVLVVFFFGCSNENIPLEHEKLVQSFGWEIDKADGDPKKLNLNLLLQSESVRKTYKQAGIDLKKYKGKTVFSQKYELQDSCSSSQVVSAVVFYTEEDLLGSYLKLSNATPGVVKMMKKAKFMENCRN